MINEDCHQENARARLCLKAPTRVFFSSVPKLPHSLQSTQEIVQQTDDGAANDRLYESIDSYNSNVSAYVNRYANIDFGHYRNILIDSCSTPPRLLVDLGCGPGRDVRAFAAILPRVIGLDLSEGLLGAARQLAPEAYFVRADLRNIPLRAGLADAVWSMASFVHLTEADVWLALRDIRRILRLHGCALISVPLGSSAEWRDDKLGGRRWFNYFDPHRFTSMVEQSGLDIEWQHSGAGRIRGEWITVVARAC